MNRGIWAFLCGLSLAGCGLTNVRSSPSATVSPSTISSSNSVEASDQANLQQQFQRPVEQGESRDYEPTTPLPDTGKVTVRNDIRNLDPDRLITDCPADSAPYAFAESTHYRVQICSQEYDPWQPKYYLGQAKDGSGELRITSSDPAEARQLIFESDGYTYILDRDAARLEQANAYLQVFTPTGDSYSEALLYLYEATAPATQ